MNIEEVVENPPEKIIKIHVNPLIGPSPYKIRNLLSLLKLEKKSFSTNFFNNSKFI